MVDAEARKIAAEAARHFVSGQITNFDLEDKMPSSNDPAIWAVEDTIWCYYDDFKEHKINDHWSVPAEVKTMMARWVMFLYTNYEYRWPKARYPGIRPIEYGFIGKLFNKHNKQKEFLSAGDYSVWPFIDKESYEKAKNNPVLLAGS